MSGLPYQSMDDLVAQSIADLEAADRDAVASRAAFAAGRFDEYWQHRVAEAEAAIEAMYERANGQGEDSPEGGGPGAGDGSGSESDGPAGPPENSEQLPEAGE